MKILSEAADVTPQIEAQIEEVLDWFEGEPISTQEFIDRLCDDYGGEWDIESYDNGAVRKIMSVARRIRRERA